MNKWEIEQFKAQGGLRTVRDGIPDDLFLACASYEPRTVAVAELLASEYRSKKGVIYVNREFLEGTRGERTKLNLNRLNEILGQHCDVVNLVEGSWLNAKDQLISLRDALVPGNCEQQSVSAKSALTQEAVITLDTTTFNREVLLTTAVLLRTRFPKSDIRAVYVSPEDYGEWLSRGFRCVRSVMGFPGILQSSRPTVLTVLSGFEPERTFKIIEEHEPAKVLRGIGDPPTTPKFLKRTEGIVNEQKLIMARQDVEEFRFPADNIDDCWKCLENLLTPCLAAHNVILAPMSTKLSTLAAFLVAEHHPEIQITYCVPGEYNIDDYSIGAKDLFIAQIPYGK